MLGFEYAVQSCALEEKYKSLPDNDDKINTVLRDPNATQFKSALIERLDFLDKAEVESAKDLYHRLFEFFHPQSKILKTFDVSGLVTFEMNRKLLELCAGFAVEVCESLTVKHTRLERSQKERVKSEAHAVLSYLRPGGRIPSCKLERQIRKLEGIEEVAINNRSHTVKIRYNAHITKVMMWW